MLAGGVLIAVASAVHYPALWGAFIWDDESAIRFNPLIISDQGLSQIWFSTHQVDYWPVSYSTLWCERRIWGENASGYRFTNILLHGANAVLFWRLASRLAVPVPWLCALIFAVHPLSVESVDWIIQRKTLLATTFSFGSLLLALTSRDGHRATAYWLAIGLFVLAMLSKTSAVMIPVVLLLLVWWQQRRLVWRDITWVAPWFIVSLIFGLISLWFQEYKAIGEEVVRDDSIPARLAAAGWCIWFYLYKAVLPVRLSFVYPRWDVDPYRVSSYIPLVAVGIVLGLFYWKRSSWGAALWVASACYVVTLVPVLGLANIYFMKFSLVADHWQYLALPAIIALVVGTMGHAARWRPTIKKPAVGIAVAACLLLSVATATRAAIFGATDNEPLWRDALAKNPNGPAVYHYLGRLFAERKEWAKAVPYYQKAVELAPGDYDSRLNLGTALSFTGARNEAQLQFAEALRLRPNLPAILRGLAMQNLQLGRDAEAITYYLRVLLLQPTDSESLLGVANVLTRQNRLDQAAQYLVRAIAVDQNAVSPHLLLGETLYKLGKIDESTSEFGIAARLSPNLAEAQFGLGQSLADAGKLDEAARHLQLALQLQPNYQLARQKLSQVEARQRKSP